MIVRLYIYIYTYTCCLKNNAFKIHSLRKIQKTNYDVITGGIKNTVSEASTTFLHIFPDNNVEIVREVYCAIHACNMA